MKTLEMVVKLDEIKKCREILRKCFIELNENNDIDREDASYIKNHLHLSMIYLERILNKYTGV